jgi:hypothetical protein
MLARVEVKLNNVGSDKKQSRVSEQFDKKEKKYYLYCLLAYGPTPRAFEESKLWRYLQHFRGGILLTDEQRKAIDIVESMGRREFTATRDIDAMPLACKLGSTDAEIKTAIQRYSS